ncbi:hypothetical protein GGI12_002726 [Dipsacomyces acuminosporus]|nr:hypothetical protein GGI12_002726 [Dipsacomyces acuminosporus]
MHCRLSSPPPSLSLGTNNIVVHAPISEPSTARLHPVGTCYASYLRRRQNNISEADDYVMHILPQELERAKLSQTSAADDNLVLDKVDSELMYLDPARWKEQDHYLVLGLSSLRYKAAPAQIKRAHQLRALEFHPDKRAAKAPAADADDFFKCVQRAYEVLSDPIRRRQFDSVDPAISDDIPRAKMEAGQDFFEVYGPVFEREARFSKRQPVPQLGNMGTSREETEEFYRFWTAFDSWRSYEYLDKEKEQTENREEKRWQDKQNKAERTRLKKEDIKRLSTLVSQAMAVDPRIGMYKEQERARKEQKRAAKEAAAKEAELERQRADEQRKQKEAQIVEEERRQAAEEKRRRELKKKEMRAAKKFVREFIKEHNYMITDDGQAPAMTKASRSSEIDVLLENLSQESLAELQKKLTDPGCDQPRLLSVVTGAIVGVIEKSPAVAISFTSFVRGHEVAERVKRDRQQQSDTKSSSKQREWTAEELELLIKATNKFPGGTINRWETISKWLSHHGGFARRSGDELLQRTQELRKGSKSRGGALVKELQNKKLNNDDKNIANEASVRYDGPSISQEPAAKPLPKKDAKPERPWSSEEQSQLERALQAYPPSYKGEDRWDKIAEAVIGRSKKECKLRVKFLAEQVRLKKAAGH